MSDDRRRLAADLFNHVWTLLDKPDRTPQEDDEMLHAAHASRFHWAEVGAPVNLVRGEWQVSRVYSALGRAEPAGKRTERDRYEKLAREAGERIADADDREHFLADLSTLP